MHRRRVEGWAAELPPSLDPAAWPNDRDGAGNIARQQLRSQEVDAPHTLAADAGGNLSLTERPIGGRLTKLARYRAGS